MRKLLTIFLFVFALWAIDTCLFGSICYASSETYLINDNFESYTTDQFPSSGGWNEVYNGSGNNKISANRSLSGTKSLYLSGQVNWAAVIGNQKAHWSRTAKIVGYEVSVYPESPQIDVGFYDQEPIWGSWYYSIVFNSDGYIYLKGDYNFDKSYAQLCPYELNKWYKIKVIIDSANNKCTVYVNDEVKALDVVTNNDSSSYSINDSYFVLSSDNNTSTAAYYDDVKVWYSNTTSSNTVSSTATSNTSDIDNAGSAYLLNENFESYATNKLPNSGWTEIYNGSGNNKVSDQKSLSGKKSLYLGGQYYWAAVVGNKNALWPKTAKTVGYELNIYPQTANIDFGFYDENPKWGWWYYAVIFNEDGYIYLTGGESDLTGGKTSYIKICSWFHCKNPLKP